ncbi:MAG TPA: lactate racemase domain-containing protein [Anaerolineae bacterium]|nr:lactate racemase domain-containing protein [Anaerolineae bacterium]
MQKILTNQEIESIVGEGLASLPLNGKRVLILIPDSTRTIPLPLFFRLLIKYLRPRVAAITFLIALGTHPPLPENALLKLLGLAATERANEYGDILILNHAWQDANALVTLGEISADEIADLSGGLFHQAVPVRLNRMILDYDELLICGPVFPHEVVGFSGGNKYFFPGIAGQDIIDFTHWLGALITSYEIIGTRATPVRRVIDRAAALIPRSRHAFCSVVTHDGVAGLYFGTPEEAWSAAAALSAQVHIHWLDKPYGQVLAVLPEMYNELWVGAKGMYKTEPIVAEGGQVILYAPHLREISVVHGERIRAIGYHVRDYFVKQWERFKDMPWGVLAHSTHLRGIGTYQDGVESPRIQVTLATQIPEDVCRAMNLGYCNPAEIDVDAWSAREKDGVLVVPRAGEYLYRLGQTRG